MRPSRARLLGAARRAVWLAVFALGTWALLRPAVRLFGEHLADLWVYQSWEAHRFTAMAMLTGSLRYHHSLLSLVGDEEVYNGAGYTHWGYGVPLLQLPFHAVARHLASLPARFFPDRAIFFAYLAVAVPLTWAGLDRVIALREKPGSSRLRRHALSWAATSFVLCTGLYPHLASRFQVHDETMAYFVLVELAALSAYAFLLGSSRSLPVVALAVAAGLGLLVRPTGAILLGVWWALVVLERRSRRATLVFCGSVAPFVIFWLATNWARTGAPWSLGFQNSLPGPDRVDMVRFGSVCVDTAEHTRLVAESLFRALFVAVPEDAPPGPPPWGKVCGLAFEPRNIAEWRTALDPYLGAGVLAFLVWTLLHSLFRRDRRLASFLPHAGIACLFAMYVYGGAGFAWRYVGDFWPLIFLAAVQYVRTLPRAAPSLLGWPLAAVLFVGGFTAYRHDVEPGKKLIENLDPSKVPAMWGAFEGTRSDQDRSLSSKVKCSVVLPWPQFNVFWRWNILGWRGDCTVEKVTEVFLGVPSKKGDAYLVRFTTEGMSAESARLYVNGRMYSAKRTGDAYEAPVRIPFDSLSSPTVLVSIEWRRGLDPVEGKLLAVEIQ